MGVIDASKTLANALLKIKDPELMAEYVKLQQYVMELVEDNTLFREENRALKDAMALQRDITVENGVYFIINGDESKNGPFCTRCWDKDKHLIRLKVRENGFANCPECKNEFDYKYKKESVTSTLNRRR